MRKFPIGYQELSYIHLYDRRNGFDADLLYIYQLIYFLSYNIHL